MAKIKKLCPRCFRPLQPYGEFGLVCPSPDCYIEQYGGELNRPTTIAQDDYRERKEDNQVHKVIGFKVKMDPEIVVLSWFKKMFRREV